MAAESTRGSELTELVSYHILGYINRDELVSVVNGNRLTYEIRRDHACARPGLDDRLVALGSGDNLSLEFRIDIRSFL